MSDTVTSPVKVSVFRGIKSKRVAKDGSKPDPDAYYFEPRSHSGKTLFSEEKFDTREAAITAAALNWENCEIDNV